AGREPSAALPAAAAYRPHRSLEKGQHLLLVGRVAVRLNEIAGRLRDALGSGAMPVMESVRKVRRVTDAPTLRVPPPNSNASPRSLAGRRHSRGDRVGR